MKKFISQKIVALMLVIVTLCSFSVNVSFAKIEKVDTNINEQQVKVFENDEYILYAQKDSSAELSIKIFGEIEPRAIPNHVGSKITQVDGNRVKVVSTNYGVDTVDRVRISAFMTNYYGYSSRSEANEYNIRPLFHRTNIFTCSNWQTMTFTIEIWDGGDYDSNTATIVRKR